MILDDLKLLSGTDVGFPEAKCVIHQPTVKEISFIGEERFFLGCEFLKFTKDRLSQEDKDGLKDQTNFDIIMSIMNDNQHKEAMENTLNVFLLFTLLFPNYEVQIRKNGIALLKTVEDSIEESIIDNSNFDIFKKILSQIFCFSDDSEDEFNPAGDLSKEIAEKLKEHRRRKAMKNNKTGKFSILPRYVSILAVGENKDMNQLLNYTIYQLYDEFTRYRMKITYDITLQAKMAGAKNIKEVDDWMKDIHEDKK